MKWLDIIGIHRLTTYNLCLILSNSNETNLIRYYRKKYLII